MERAIVRGLRAAYHIGLTHISQWLLETVATFTDVCKLLRADPRARGIVSTRGLEVLGSEILNEARRSRQAPDGIREIIILLEGDIRDRREASRWLRGGITAGAAESDRGHRYFIETLQNLLEDLKTVKRDYGPAEITSTDATPVEPQPNCFAALDVEDSSDAFTTSFEVNLNPQSKTPQLVTFELETEESRRDKLSIALLKHFKACQTARERLQTLWRDQHDGKITLKTASSVTNAAVALLGKAFNMIADEYPECKKSDCLMDMLELRFVVENGLAKTMEGEYVGFVLGEETSPRANLYCMPAWTMLMLLNACRRVEARRELHADKTELKELIKCHQTGRILSKTLTGFEQLASAKRSGRWAESLDIFTSDMFDFLAKGTFDISTLINFQIQMDIFDIVGEDGNFETPLDLWQHIWALTSQGLRGLLATTKEVQCEIDDITQKTPGHWMEQEMDKKNALLEKCAMVLCSKLPVLAGSYHWSVTDHIQRCGLQLCEFEKVAVAVAHLYRVYQKRGLIRDNCDDLERFIQMQGADRLQLRDIDKTPTPMGSAARNFGLAMGIPLAKYKEYEKLPVPDKLDNAVKLHQASSWLKYIGTTNLTSQDLPVKLQNLMHHIITTNVVDIPEVLKTDWEAKQGITLAHFIDLLEATLNKEEPNVSFGYASFFADCANVLMCSMPPTGRHYPFHQHVNDLLWNAGDHETFPKLYKETDFVDAADGFDLFAIGEPDASIKIGRQVMDLQRECEGKADLIDYCTELLDEDKKEGAGKASLLKEMKKEDKEAEKAKGKKKRKPKHKKKKGKKADDDGDEKMEEAVVPTPKAPKHAAVEDADDIEDLRPSRKKARRM